MKALLKLAVAGAIVVSTYYAIVRIAEYKADALAGGGTFVLDGRHAAENGALDALSGQLRGWGEHELAASLVRLQGAGHLWVAPRLTGGRSAICVNALGLVSRIYLREDELVARGLPFPDLGIPDAARRTFATIRLAGTLFHELQHYQGVEDERVAYEREMGFYHGLGERNAEGLEGEEKRWFEWAVASALETAAAAREKALGRQTLDRGRAGLLQVRHRRFPPRSVREGVAAQMTPEDSTRLGGLLLGQRLVALGVVAEGEPIVGLLPYAVSADRSALIVQSSSLARHSKGLVAGAPWSGMIHEPDSAETDPLQVARLQIEGVVDPLRGDRPEFQPAARAFLARFPQAAMTLQLPDFTLHRLEIRGGRMVLGFGRALNLSGEQFRDLARA